MKHIIEKIKSYFGLDIEEELEVREFAMSKDEQIKAWKQLCADQQELLSNKDLTIRNLTEEVYRLSRINECQADLLERKWGING